MFKFRIINLPNGDQVIDPSLKTPHNALTSDQMQEYIEMEVQLYIADRQKKKALKQAEKQRRLARNPLYRMACFCGLV